MWSRKLQSLLEIENALHVLRLLITSLQKEICGAHVIRIHAPEPCAAKGHAVEYANHADFPNLDTQRSH